MRLPHCSAEGRGMWGGSLMPERLRKLLLELRAGHEPKPVLLREVWKDDAPFILRRKKGLTKISSSGSSNRATYIPWNPAGIVNGGE